MKRAAQIIVIVVAAAVTGSCAGMSVGSDYDASADFSSFKTYAWMDRPKTGEGQDSQGLMDTRIKEDVARELESKGLERTSADPDLLVAYHTGSQNRLEVDDWGYGDWSGAGGGNVFNYNEGTLVVDLIDAKTENLVWRGTAADTVPRNSKSEEIADKISKAIEKMFTEYPPKQRSNKEGMEHDE